VDEKAKRIFIAHSIAFGFDLDLLKLRQDRGNRDGR
jgi:hypothetical protein